MTRTLLRSHNLVLIALFAGLLVVSCDDDVGGRPTPQFANFSLAPSFVTHATGVVDINRIHVVLTRESDQSVALDTVFQVTLGAHSVALTLTVTLRESPESFQLTMYFITPTNDTAFVGGPVSVTASTDTPSDAPQVPINVPTVYVGVGARPYRIRLVLRRMKSIRMHWPSVIVFVKRLLPRAISHTFFTNRAERSSRSVDTRRSTHRAGGRSLRNRCK